MSNVAGRTPEIIRAEYLEKCAQLYEARLKIEQLGAEYQQLEKRMQEIGPEQVRASDEFTAINEKVSSLKAELDKFN